MFFVISKNISPICLLDHMYILAPTMHIYKLAFLQTTERLSSRLWFSVRSQRGLPGGSDGKEPTCQCRNHGFDPWVGKIPWTSKWQPTPGFLPGKSHGQSSLVGCSPWGHKRVRHDSETKTTTKAPTKTNSQLWHCALLFQLTGQYWNQETDTGITLLTGLQALFSYRQLLPALICVCLCSGIPCVDLCDHHRNQCTGQFGHHKGTASRCPLLAPPSPCSVSLKSHVFSIFTVLSFRECFINEMYATF